MCHVCTKLQSYMYHVVNGRKHFYTLQKSQTRLCYEHRTFHYLGR